MEVSQKAQKILFRSPGVKNKVTDRNIFCSALYTEVARYFFGSFFLFSFAGS